MSIQISSINPLMLQPATNLTSYKDEIIKVQLGTLKEFLNEGNWARVDKVPLKLDNLAQSYFKNLTDESETEKDTAVIEVKIEHLDKLLNVQNPNGEFKYKIDRLNNRIQHFAKTKSNTEQPKVYTDMTVKVTKKALQEKFLNKNNWQIILDENIQNYFTDLINNNPKTKKLDVNVGCLEKLLYIQKDTGTSARTSITLRNKIEELKTQNRDQETKIIAYTDLSISITQKSINQLKTNIQKDKTLDPETENYFNQELNNNENSKKILVKVEHLKKLADIQNKQAHKDGNPRSLVSQVNIALFYLSTQNPNRYINSKITINSLIKEYETADMETKTKVKKNKSLNDDFSIKNKKSKKRKDLTDHTETITPADQLISDTTQITASPSPQSKIAKSSEDKQEVQSPAGDVEQYSLFGSFGNFNDEYFNL